MTRTANFVSGSLTENERRHQEALKRGSIKALRTARKRAKQNQASVTLTPTSAPMASVTAPSVPIVTGNQAPAPPKTRKRRYALVLDCSQSMQHFGRGPQDMTNTIQNHLLLEDSDGATVVTPVLFGNTIEVGPRNVPKGLKPFRSWPNMGNTALYDAVILACEAVEKDAEPDDTFCVIVVTDGEENWSSQRVHGYTKNVDFARAVRTRQDTGRYTLVFNLPPGKKNAFVQMTGLPAGNMQEWGTTQEVEAAVTAGITSYTHATQAGANSVTNFLLDAGSISFKDFDSCPDIKGPTTKVWAVDKPMRINEFVESHPGVTFQPGRSYYQLTKSEKVEEGKELIVLEKTFAPNGSKTAEVIRGNARKVLQQKLGFPDGEIKKLTPGNLSSLEIYCQSTSNNRILVQGTRLIYLL